VELGFAKMDCQRKIVAKIIDKEAGHVLALKAHQSTPCWKHAFGMTRGDVELFFVEQTVAGLKGLAVNRNETLENSGGRIETRRYTAIDDIDWLKWRHDWAGLMSVVMVERVREIISKKSEPETETRFYFSSLAA
jgi:hypothetical protein